MPALQTFPAGYSEMQRRADYEERLHCTANHDETFEAQLKSPERPLNELSVQVLSFLANHADHRERRIALKQREQDNISNGSVRSNGKELSVLHQREAVYGFLWTRFHCISGSEQCGQVHSVAFLF